MSADQESSAVSAHSGSRTGATSDGREVGEGGSYLVRRTAASALGKKDIRVPAAIVAKHEL